MKNSAAEKYADLLYRRIPEHYRAYDAENGLPLLALMRIVGRQFAHLRRDLDDLWDNFFIETCDDWVVPYLGALVGTNLLARPVGQSNRLDVRRTVQWRRSKGTPMMLQSLAQAISGWPAELDEFFESLGWSQNLNHLRMNRPLTADCRKPYPLSRLGHVDDPLTHSADFRAAGEMDQARQSAEGLGIGRAAWGTPGRYQIKKVGIFVRRLQTFPIRGATPATAAPGVVAPVQAGVFSFDPLLRGVPLFVGQTGAPLSRAEFGQAPWETFGNDVAVRQFGVLLASEAEPTPDLSSGRGAFTFGQAGAGLVLHAASGLRVMEPRPLRRGGVHFVLTALWINDDASPATELGSLSTFHAVAADGDAFHPGAAAAKPGRLAIRIRLGGPGLGWPKLPSSPPARFPGAVLAVRAARTGAIHAADGLYVYLPPAYLTPGKPAVFFVADDGTTYDFATRVLARSAEGQVHPPRVIVPSLAPAYQFTTLHRVDAGMRLVDPARFGDAKVLIQADLINRLAPPAQGDFLVLPLGGVATAALVGTNFPDLAAPAAWPAFQFVPSHAALNGKTVPEATGATLPTLPLLTLLVKPLAGNFIPPSEVVLVNRHGQGLLVYLPEIAGADSAGVRLLVADDGSTYQIPPAVEDQRRALTEGSFAGMTLARAAAGQVLPIPGVWPLQQRRPVALDLCRFERSSLLRADELGIDPELGLFAFSPGDPAIGQGKLSVDYVEAFADRVGARTFDRSADLVRPATRLVAGSGDSSHPLALDSTAKRLHSSLAEAILAADEDDVIEIVDSATYVSSSEVVVKPTKPVTKLTVRAAAGQRPCLSFYDVNGAATASSLRVSSALAGLELSGLFISGGAIRLEAAVSQLTLKACTLDPLAALAGSLTAVVGDQAQPTAILVTRSITGGLRLGAGVASLTVADSIIDQQGKLAVAGLPPPNPPAKGVKSAPLARVVQLERVTVFGEVWCETLTASECLLGNLVVVADQQAGCIRFSRLEPGSVLPRRFQCLPAEMSAAIPGHSLRRMAPAFNACRFGRPGYAQLASSGPAELLWASEEGSEIGAFTGALNSLRLANLKTKLAEYLPVGLSALIIAET